MWSLYEQKATEDSSDGANLFNYSGEKLEPLKFSNGKTQADIVKETLDAIEAGNKIILVRKETTLLKTVLVSLNYSAIQVRLLVECLIEITILTEYVRHGTKTEYFTCRRASKTGTSTVTAKSGIQMGRLRR